MVAGGFKSYLVGGRELEGRGEKVLNRRESNERRQIDVYESLHNKVAIEAI